jgi:hypothetical protein
MPSLERSEICCEGNLRLAGAEELHHEMLAVGIRLVSAFYFHIPVSVVTCTPVRADIN